MTRSIQLDGIWRFQRLAETVVPGVRRPVRGAKVRDIRVPSNWYLEGEDFSGEALLERTFTAPPLRFGEGAYLRFKGADYFLSAELNGRAVGRHEGYFQTFDFRVSEVLQAKNVLKVRLDSPKESTRIWPHEKKLIKGIFNHHDARPGSWDKEHGQDMNTGGLWGGVELLIVDRVFLRQTRISSTLLPDGRALLTARLTLLNVSDPEEYELRFDLKGDNFPGGRESVEPHRVFLPRGASEVVLTHILKKPRLWWTWDHGRPDLYRATFSIRRSSTRTIVETGSMRFGVRSIEVTKAREFILNGRRIFPRGTNIIPTQWLSEYGPEKARRDVGLMRGANLNAVRVHAHVNRHAFYEACDEAGLMVWQDFALQWSYERSNTFNSNAVRQIREMVRELYNHPSIILWCCHNEPSVNRRELDPMLARAVREEDSSRQVDEASDFNDHPYPGWYWDDRVTGGRIGWPDARVGTFSEFGFQALPSLSLLKKMFPKKGLWPPDWKAWALRDFQYYQTFEVAGIRMGKSLKQFVANSQEYQAHMLREYIATLRSHKYRPMNGFFQFMFADCWPAITWSVVDYERTPKAGYHALKEACQPVWPLWRPWTRVFYAGDVLNHGHPPLDDVTIINDYHRVLKGVRVTLAVTDPKGRTIYRAAGRCNVPADSVVQPFDKGDHFGQISKPCRFKEGAPVGIYRLRVSLHGGGIQAASDSHFEVKRKGTSHHA